MQLKKNVALSESGFIFNPSTGDAFSTNSLGLKILDFLKQGKEKEEIMYLIMEQYDVGQEELESDLIDFFNQLRQMKLIQNDQT